MNNGSLSLVEIMIFLGFIFFILLSTVTALRQNSVEKTITCRKGEVYEKINDKVWRGTGETCFVE